MGINQSERMIKWQPRDLWSAISHLLGFLLSLVGTVFLVIRGNEFGGTTYAWGFAIFGVTMILLYLASASYHWLEINKKINLILRKLDHAMIYVLIAGTYTPICLILLGGIWRAGILLTIWALALAGILLTLFYFEAPRWLTTGIYILMGWLGIVIFIPQPHTMPMAGFIWLLAGGIFYTIGGIIYGRKRSLIDYPGFGFHEVFHIFVLAGSVCHYFMMYLVLVQI